MIYVIKLKVRLEREMKIDIDVSTMDNAKKWNPRRDRDQIQWEIQHLLGII